MELRRICLICKRAPPPRLKRVAKYGEERKGSVLTLSSEFSPNGFIKVSRVQIGKRGQGTNSGFPSAFAPVLKANGGGSFARVNSVVSLKSFANFATDSASKAAAYSLNRNADVGGLKRRAPGLSSRPPAKVWVPSDDGWRKISPRDA